MIDSQIVEKHKNIIFKEMFYENDYDSLVYMVNKFDIHMNYKDICTLIMNDQIDVVKEIFDKTKYNRKELKSILLISCRNPILLSYFVDDCEILPSISCIRRSHEQGYDLSLDFLINHKTFTEVYNRNKEQLPDDELGHLIKQRVRELKLNRINN